MERHKPVMVQEVLECMEIVPGNIVFDGTLGLGGHAKHFVSVMRGGAFIGVDADADALTQAQEYLAPLPDSISAHFVEGNFRNIAAIADSLGIDRCDRVLLDLGWGSHQLESGRGFSFMHDEPLTMCYGTREGACTVTAFDVVNLFEEKNLADIIRGYGGERWAVRIAKHIVEERSLSPIETTGRLAAVVSGAIPRRFHPKRIHAATRTFQAIRITVNDEVRALEDFFDSVRPLLCPGSRVVIIAFHSLEDRVVKRTFKQWEQEGFGKRYTKKALRPSDDECQQNPRARSAKLRTFIII